MRGEKTFNHLDSVLEAADCLSQEDQEGSSLPPDKLPVFKFKAKKTVSEDMNDLALLTSQEDKAIISNAVEARCIAASTRCCCKH